MFLGATKLNNTQNSSINVLSASLDLNFQNYCLILDKKPYDQETENILNGKIGKLRDLAVEVFKLFKIKNGFLPKFIVYFRDRISLSDEKLNIYKHELLIIKNAYKEVNQGFSKPLITCIAVCRETGTIFENKNLSAGIAIEPLFIMGTDNSYSREFYLSSQQTNEVNIFKIKKIFKTLI